MVTLLLLLWFRLASKGKTRKEKKPSSTSDLFCVFTLHYLYSYLQFI